MSCFSGSFLSLPGVRCDRFDCLGEDGSNVPAHHLFLSHCHADHMVGLEDVGSFLKKRKRDAGPRRLYCSSVSSVFVQKKYADIPRDAIVEMLPNNPYIITVRDSALIYNIRVTAINANHCPGSLMFLMEKLDFMGAVSKRILYTGDFRFDYSGKPLTFLKALHSGSVPLHIDEMYLDTTFCSDDYPSFPTRQEAENNIWRICEEWVKKNRVKKRNNPKYLVRFHLPARYGYEAMFHTIYQKSGYEWRVHVPSSKFSEYLCSSALEDCTDPDPDNAPYIHACPSLTCQPRGIPVAVCTIRPSAIFFTRTRMAAIKEASGLDYLVGVSKGSDSYRVCYSTHSSLEELEIFVKHFSPGKIIPCAIPPGSTKEEVGNILAAFLQSDSVGSIDKGDKQSSLQGADSLTKISYNDTLDLGCYDLLGEKEINPDFKRGKELNKSVHEKSFQNLNLVLELSEDEGEDISNNENNEKTLVVIESDSDCEQNTPEIEDIIADAEENELPEYVIKTMKEYKKRKDAVFDIY